MNGRGRKSVGLSGMLNSLAFARFPFLAVLQSTEVSFLLFLGKTCLSCLHHWSCCPTTAFLLSRPLSAVCPASRLSALPSPKAMRPQFCSLSTLAGNFHFHLLRILLLLLHRKPRRHLPHNLCFNTYSLCFCPQGKTEEKQESHISRKKCPCHWVCQEVP